MRTPCQNPFFLVCLIVLTCLSCKSWKPAGFLQRPPREAYSISLRASSLGQTAAGLRWTGDADTALRHPSTVTLPYREHGVFPAGVNAASVLLFQLTRGERLFVKIEGSPGRAPFLELYRLDTSSRPERLLSPAPGAGMVYDPERSGTFALLIQGRLDTQHDYRLTLASAPSLAYPAVNPARNRIGSVWGDARDAGARRHEGVDIFAPKGSPALAAAPGRITRLTNGGIGGKTVWLRPESRSISLYYAHLDSQWVREGDFVRSGDTLGQIGNTGNARFTAAHLHFGIYTAGGAVDPAPFIRPKDTGSPVVKVSPALIGTIRELPIAARLSDRPGSGAVPGARLASGTTVRIVAASGDQLRVRIADTLSGWIPYSKRLFNDPAR